MVWSLITGGLAGWLAGRLMRGTGYGLLVNIVLGLLGGLVGDLVFGVLGLTATNLIGRLICATAGAVLLVALARAVRR